MANIQSFPIADLEYGEATNTGLYTVCKAIHPKGYMAVQLPPCTLAHTIGMKKPTKTAKKEVRLCSR